MNLIFFLTSNFRLFLNIVFFLLGDSPASEFYVPTFRNAPSLPSSLVVWAAFRLEYVHLYAIRCRYGNRRTKFSNHISQMPANINTIH